MLSQPFLTRDIKQHTTRNEIPIMSTASRQKATLFVGGLDPQVSQQTLHDAFLPFGEIVDVSLPKPEQYMISSSPVVTH